MLDLLSATAEYQRLVGGGEEEEEEEEEGDGEGGRTLEKVHPSQVISF